jgi:hypothetical protein
MFRLIELAYGAPISLPTSTLPSGIAAMVWAGFRDESTSRPMVDQAVPVYGILWTRPPGLRKYRTVLDSKAKS